MKYKIVFTGDNFRQEHVVSRKAADTISKFLNTNGYYNFSDVKTVEVQQYVWKS